MVRAAGFGSDLDWTESDFNKSFGELSKVLGNCLNRILKMVGNYCGGKVPAAEGTVEPMDQALIDRTRQLADQVRAAYARYDLQAAVMLPIDLARQTNGHIDSTEPFKLAKDPLKAQRLNTVLHVQAQAIARALVALIPVLSEKAIEGLRQLNVDVTGRSFDELMSTNLPVGHQLGEGKPLFPRVEPQKG